MTDPVVILAGLAALTIFALVLAALLAVHYLTRIANALEALGTEREAWLVGPLGYSHEMHALPSAGGEQAFIVKDLARLRDELERGAAT